MIPSDIEKLKQAFGDREFSGKQLGEALGLLDYRATGAILKGLRRDGIAYQTRKGWRFGARPDAPVKAEAPAIAAPIVESAPVCAARPLVVRIGDYFLHEHLGLIADVVQIDAIEAVRLYTSIIEVDPATKHPRNKIVKFLKSRDPKEYAAMRAWLDSMAGNPPHVDDTALELAAELESKLNAAQKEIAELKAKIDAIRGMFRGEL